MKFCFGTVCWNGYLERYIDIFINNYVTIFKKLISLGINYEDIAAPKVIYNNDEPGLKVENAIKKLEIMTGKKLNLICDKHKYSTDKVMYSTRNRLRNEFKKTYPVEEQAKSRVTRPSMAFYGTEILNRAVTALLEGENLLLCGDKATGKNVLAENLAWIFGRPVYDISFHVNTDSSSLIGTDTFVDNEVKLREGPIYQCARWGGFGILDEINMAKSDAVSVLHQVLDFRRTLDVPGYDRISLHPAARFIATMNYGYAGTKELNEALVSRFMVIHMPSLTIERMYQILENLFPGIRREAREQFAGLFLDLQLKAQNGEISTKAVDMRGLIGALRLVRGGLTPLEAIDMGITNKTFDTFERELIGDLVMTRIPGTWDRGDVFDE